MADEASFQPPPAGKYSEFAVNWNPFRRVASGGLKDDVRQVGRVDAGGDRRDLGGEVLISAAPDAGERPVEHGAAPAASKSVGPRLVISSDVPFRGPAEAKKVERFDPREDLCQAGQPIKRSRRVHLAHVGHHFEGEGLKRHCDRVFGRAKGRRTRTGGKPDRVSSTSSSLSLFSTADDCTNTAESDTRCFSSIRRADGPTAAVLPRIQASWVLRGRHFLDPHDRAVNSARVQPVPRGGVMFTPCPTSRSSVRPSVMAPACSM